MTLLYSVNVGQTLIQLYDEGKCYRVRVAQQLEERWLNPVDTRTNSLAEAHRKIARLIDDNQTRRARHTKGEGE